MNTSCATGLLVSVPRRIDDNALSTHDGYYSIVTGFITEPYGAPVYEWRQRRTGPRPTARAFLFRASNGAWVLGPNATHEVGKIQSNAFDAACPADMPGNSSWAFYNGLGTSWNCTTWDAACGSGSGITVEPHCVEVDAYATGADRFIFSACTYPAAPPAPQPPPPLPPGMSMALLVGLVSAAAGTALLLAVALIRWWWRRREDIEYGHQMNGCQRRARVGQTRPSVSRPSPVAVRRVGGRGLPNEYSPTRPPGRLAHSATEMRAITASPRRDQFV